MENLSHSRQPNKQATSVSKKACNGSNFITKTIYDDVFGGPPKVGTPTLAPRMEDYSEIFGGFHAKRPSSIPVLDLPVVDEEDAFFDVRSSGFDYDEVFGGLDGLDCAVSFEELMMEQSNGVNGDVDSCEEAWTPEETESLSEGSGKNQNLSNGDPYESVAGRMEFNISFHKTNQRSDEDMSNGITHVTVLHAIPEYTFLVDKTTPLEKACYENPPLELTDDSNLHMDFDWGVMKEKNLKKTLSQPCIGTSGEQTFANCLKPQRGYSRSSSLPNETFVTISEISLRTQPSEVPPPCRPAPLLDAKIGDSGKITKNCRTTAAEGTMGHTSPPFYDVEVDASSSAATSAATMKEVMEKAQAKLKTAKVLLERKREGIQSRKHDRKDKEGKIFGTVGGSSSIKEERLHDSCERLANGMRFSVREEMQSDTKTMRAVPDAIGGENLFNVDKTLAEMHGCSDKIDGAGEWKEAMEFFELVKADRSTIEHINYDESLVQDTKIHDSRQKIKRGAMEAVEHQQAHGSKIETNSKDPELGEIEEKLKSAKEAYERQESNRRSGASKATRKLKGHEKQVKVAQEVFELVECEKNFKMVQHSMGIEKKPTGAEEPEKLENLVKVQQKESRFEEEQAMKHWDNEKPLQETNRSKENETRFKESCEREANGRRHKEAFEKDENEKMLKGALEQVENDKKVKEALVQEDKEAFEQKENEKLQREAREREENEKQQREARIIAAYEKQQREAHEREEYEKRQREAREREEHERQQREALEREEYVRLQREAREREDYERQLREAQEREEYERQLREALEREEYERQQKEAHEREENEKKLKEALENEEREKKQKEAAKREETEKRLQEACEQEEMEQRLKEAREREETRKRLGEEHKQGNNCAALKEGQGRMEKCEIRSKEALGREENRNMSKEARVETEKRVKDAEDLKELNKVLEQTRWDECGKELKMAGGPLVFKEVEDHGVLEKGHLLGDNDSIQVTQQTGQHAENNKKGLVTQGALVHEENVGILIENTDTEMVGEAVETPNVLVDRRFEVFSMAQGNLKHVEHIFKMKDVVEPLCKDHTDRTSESGTGIGQEKTNSILQNDSTIKNQEKKYANEWVERQTNINHTQVGLNQKENKDKFVPTQPVKESVHNGRKIETSRLLVLEGKGNIQKTAQSVNASQSLDRQEKNINETLTLADKEAQRMKRERELENERLRRIEEEREREREREKDRMAVDIATLEAREKAYVEVRERAERSAVERATTEARQRALAEARERLEKACAEVKEKSLTEKACMEARLRAERAAVERATVEARERAVERAMAERAALEARERVDRTLSEKFSGSSKNSAMRSTFSPPELQDQKFQSASTFNSSRYPYCSGYSASYNTEISEGESAQRCKARLERHQRTAERAAKALAEKNMRDLLAQREQAERNRLAETLDADVKRWSSGKEGNLRALLSTLQYILGPDSGWHPIPLTEVITSAAVKKAYRKATLCVHPDKLQQRGASIQQKYICEKVFDLLKEAWNKFNSEER